MGRTAIRVPNSRSHPSRIPGKTPRADTSQCHHWDMGDVSSEDLLAFALASARLRAIRVALLPLHKTLVDAERSRYERAHGRIESAQRALRLLIEDPWFAWIQPL